MYTSNAGHTQPKPRKDEDSDSLARSREKSSAFLLLDPIARLFFAQATSVASEQKFSVVKSLLVLVILQGQCPKDRSPHNKSGKSLRLLALLFSIRLCWRSYAEQVRT